MAVSALQVYAGERARRILVERGLRPEDVGVVAAAAGGPKGLVLNRLDRFVFGRWLHGGGIVHLLGASIGAWRMACAAHEDPVQALAELEHDYIHQRYEHVPGRPPSPGQVSRALGATLEHRLAGRAAALLAHPRYRLHVFASRGRGMLGREGRLRTPLGYLGAWVANGVGRRHLGRWLERVVFCDPRDALPLRLDDFRSSVVPLQPGNLAASVLASCSIPFWLEPVRTIAGAPPGPYWDGGITDYHLHLDYASMPSGLALYPHFQPMLVPGWLDKGWRRRHRASGHLSNVVVVAPSPHWVAALPDGKLPDRTDFKRYADDFDGRVRAWTRAAEEGQRLADEFAALVERDSIEAQPLP